MEKERCETVTQVSDRVYIVIRSAFPRLFQSFAMRKLRPYFRSYQR